MKNFIARALLLGLATLGLAFSVQAWDETGHKITAYIAWQRMTPATRERVIKILTSAAEDSQLATFYASYGSRTLESRQREFFMLASTWPDIVRDRNFEIRYKKYHHGTWHYSDTFWKVVDGRAELLPKSAEGGLAVEKMIDFEKIARDTSATDAEKALAISWLEHLIGDIHQPLHASGRVTDLEPKGDQGGNLFSLTPKDTPRDKQENLHWFWDSIIARNLPNKKDACDTDYIDPIAKKIIAKYPFDKMQSRLDLANFDDWRKESYEIASTKVYPPELKRGETPSEKYRKGALKIAQERLALAGYRMGELFNQVFGAAGPVGSPTR